MSKIVIDAREWGSSTGRYISNLVLNLEKLDSKNKFVILLKSRDMDKYSPKNVNFVKQVSDWKEFTLEEQNGLKKQLDDLKPDLVHFGMTQQPIRYAGKSVTTVHDLTTLRFVNPVKNPVVFRFKQRVYARVIKRATKHSEFLITPTDYVKDDLVRLTGVSEDKVIVTYESADKITEPSKLVRGLARKDFIMYVGRAQPHKNLKRLVKAFGELQAEFPSLQLVLAGKKDGNYELLDKYAKDHAVDNIVFTNYVSEGQLRWLYEHCQAYVFPSLSEGFGLPGLEAMAHGAPVISSDATCLPEVYGSAAYYFDPLKVDAIAESIRDVLNDNELRDKLIKAGKKRVGLYSWRRMAEETLGIYKKAL